MRIEELGAPFGNLGKDCVPTLEDGRYDLRIDGRRALPDAAGVFEGWGGDEHAAAFAFPDPTTSREERLAAVIAQHTQAGVSHDIQSGEDDPDCPVTRQVVMVDGLRDGDPQFPVVVTRPKGTEGETLPVMFVIGQGGMYAIWYNWLGVTYEPRALQHRCAIVYPECRTGNEAYVDGAVDDYQAAWAWMLEHGSEYGLDADDAMVIGSSGGGFFALCFAFRCKKVGFRPRGVLALEPVVDDIMCYPSNKMVTSHCDALFVRRLFQCCLRPGDFASPFNAPDVVPGRATVEDCRGLCPVFIHVVEMDNDRDPAMALAMRLYEADVFAEIHVWGGCAHGFSYYAPPESQIKKAMDAVIDCEIDSMLTHDLRRDWNQQGSC